MWSSCGSARQNARPPRATEATRGGSKGEPPGWRPLEDTVSVHPRAAEAHASVMMDTPAPSMALDTPQTWEIMYEVARNVP